jgi:predicted deacylase
LRGLKNVMKHLGMIPGTIERESGQTQTTYFRSIFQIRAECTGIFEPRVETRAKISTGQSIAEIKDLKGDTIEQVISTEEGLVLQIVTKRFVNNGDRLFLLLR